ncbi:MAG: prolyl oligopeptidase family serine peptidase [Planctomycetales bacterium]|nr:prolyl oligopeptidase family serine peptidase [Planctomycetales bacterium]
MLIRFLFLLMLQAILPIQGLLAQTGDLCVEIPRLLPPEGLSAPEARVAAWQQRLSTIDNSLAAYRESELEADVQVLTKACRYAIQLREFYRESDFDKIDRLLTLAEQRVAALKAGAPMWHRTPGRQVRGFRSDVDGSVQPVGLIVPAEMRETQVPLYVWLHGRGDKTTDLHFICERLDKDGQIKPGGAIVIHPFGRQCVGYKSAGETDVLEAIDFACKNYPVDRERIVLMGFSMGGAGVWHLAAHYTDRFVAASPGAGFAETARYQGLKPENYPPLYEQMLWNIYDVPGYTRNLFNIDFVAYSGEEDKQIQAARVMEEAYAANGRTLRHIIGPGMGHKYHPDSLAEIMEIMARAVAPGKTQEAKSHLYVQTRHPRYGRHEWLEIDGQEEQYQNTVAEAQLAPAPDSGAGSDELWTIATQNVARLQIRGDYPGGPRSAVVVDGTEVSLSRGTDTLLAKQQGRWAVVDRYAAVRKHPGLSGPMDDAFIDPFLVVLPTSSRGEGVTPVDQWVQCESQAFLRRWRELFRGEARVKLDQEVTQQDLNHYHLVIWGTPRTNSVLNRVFRAGADRHWPLSWGNDRIDVGQFSSDSSGQVLQAVQPNPLAPSKYVVINSGPTFRQAHDRTNSLQNPHLPDWAVVSLEQEPDDERPGKIVKAGFFDDSWQYSASLTW